MFSSLKRRRAATPELFQYFCEKKMNFSKWLGNKSTFRDAWSRFGADECCRGNVIPFSTRVRISFSFSWSFESERDWVGKYFFCVFCNDWNFFFEVRCDDWVLNNRRKGNGFLGMCLEGNILIEIVGWLVRIGSFCFFGFDLDFRFGCFGSCIFEDGVLEIRSFLREIVLAKIHFWNLFCDYFSIFYLDFIFNILFLEKEIIQWFVTCLESSLLFFFQSWRLPTFCFLSYIFKISFSNTFTNFVFNQNLFINIINIFYLNVISNCK